MPTNQKFNEALSNVNKNMLKKIFRTVVCPKLSKPLFRPFAKLNQHAKIMENIKAIKFEDGTSLVS